MFSRKGAIAAALPADLDTGTGRSSPGSTNLQRIRIDILCRSNRGSPFAPSSPRTPLAARKIPAEATPSAEDNEPCKTQEQVDTPRTRYSSGSVARHAPAFCAVDAGANPSERAPTPHASATISGDDGDKSYFTVCLFVASIADGVLQVSPGARKKHDILQHVISNVSKEQNTVVHLGSEPAAQNLKMRVFVEASIEARAVLAYIDAHADQLPAPFVILSRRMHIAVSYDPATLDPSCASVADRLRKQAKTRAVKLLREAIGDPSSGLTSRALRGHLGAHAPAKYLDAYVLARAAPIQKADCARRYVVFEAKNRCSPEIRPALHAAAAAHVAPLPSAEAQLTAYFPVSLFVTAIADGALARDILPKARDRLEQILSKIPKEQHTSVEVQDEGVLEIKMRVFAAASDDARAVADYIRQHEEQTPAPFVILANELPMALRYDPALLDPADSAVADRLRKQAKTRAVKLLREVIAHQGAPVSLRALRGHLGPRAPAAALDRLVAARAERVPGWKGAGGAPRFIAFAARSKGAAGAAGDGTATAHAPPRQDADSERENARTLPPLRAPGVAGAASAGAALGIMGAAQAAVKYEGMPAQSGICAQSLEAAALLSHLSSMAHRAEKRRRCVSPGSPLEPFVPPGKLRPASFVPPGKRARSEDPASAPSSAS